MRRPVQKSRKKSQKRSNKTRRQRGGGNVNGNVNGNDNVNGNGGPTKVEVSSLSELQYYIGSENTIITTLQLEGRLDKDTFLELCAVLGSLTYLEELFLDNNEIGDEGVSALVKLLPSMKALNTLSLALNNITVEGAKALATVLPALGELKLLELSLNNIGDEGTKALAEALPFMGALKTLTLSSCNITDKGAKALSDKLSLTNITELDLGNNKIDISGFRFVKSHDKIHSNLLNNPCCKRSTYDWPNAGH
jgi:Ran GTPase-activating protein (RanGAP) involved in mRNA processing and transport